MITDEMVARAEALLDDAMAGEKSKGAIEAARAIIACKRDQTRMGVDENIVSFLEEMQKVALELFNRERSGGSPLTAVGSVVSAPAPKCGLCEVEMELPLDDPTLESKRKLVKDNPDFELVTENYIVRAGTPLTAFVCDECKKKIKSDPEYQKI